MRGITRGKILIGILIVLIIGGLLSGQRIHDYYVKSQLDAAIELEETIKNMAAVNDYKYNITSTFIVDGRKEVISQVEGEKSGDNTHIRGEMVNTPIDIYYYDGTIYNYDSYSEKWLVIESDTSNAEELLISELNPLSNLKFKDLGNVEKLGFEGVDGKECLVVKCTPSIESQLLENLWKDFQYEIWIDYKKRYVKKATLNATNINNEKTQLEISLSFKDIGKKTNIKPPDN
ncbi:hypothetical protein SYNTR_0171 [Candidatus Syntrophocurvum alkaliphilum]|uniref:Outer membrane lipoprotein-sorting protein n=1 Tax=Candidatus Syntrophocurvum alkaliphilum TaxID=2293317 RepID=A0A6I6DBA3_9FIRM|nr:hypothetical protein [Candidatus Syntrophocurvum alkaliphilum]QGT98764.1 hypothetical protein SYNTR_0171 [Candidatus Syntrophocurvum alkaliphilum]